MKKFFTFLIILSIIGCTTKKQLTEKTKEWVTEGVEFQIKEKWKYTLIKSWVVVPQKNEIVKIKNLEIILHNASHGILFGFEYEIEYNEKYIPSNEELSYLVRLFDEHGFFLDSFMLVIPFKYKNPIKGILSNTISKGYQYPDISRVEIYQSPVKWVDSVFYFNRELQKLKFKKE
jgi:hypothetical protein